MRVALTIPALDAEATIGDVVASARRVVPDVLVVDDGSRDATAARAREAGAEVVIHFDNRGKGAALRTAFDALLGRGFDRVVTMDADGQHLAEELPLLLDAPASADLVLGVRTASFAAMSPLRRRSNALSTRAISAFASRPLVDVQTGFRRYSRALLERTGFPEDRFDAESAVVVRAARLGLEIVEVPIRLGFADGRCTSHFRPVVDGLRIARSVVRAWATTDQAAS